jgi:malate dehydrogenase
MKISIIGAGNVGGLTVMRLAEIWSGDIVLFDIVKGLACGKVYDLEDSLAIARSQAKVVGSDDINAIRESDIVVVTAGLARKPGMTREDLLNKNAEILDGLCSRIKELCANSIVIIVTNPLDLMTYHALKSTGFSPKKVFGMGVSLDAGRFANIISKELQIPSCDIEACVIGTHGEGMLPIPRLSKIKDICLDEFADAEVLKKLVAKTIGRGAQIVSLLGSGSAYFAPSLAIANIVRIIAKDEKRVVGICAYLNGEYGIKDICMGVPCRLGKDGIERIIELDLSLDESRALALSAGRLKEQYSLFGKC